MGRAIAVRTDYTIDEARGVCQAVEGEQARQSSGDCGGAQKMSAQQRRF